MSASESDLRAACAALQATSEEIELARLAAAHYGRPNSEIPALIAFERHRIKQAAIPSMPGLSHAIPNFVAGFKAGQLAANVKQASVSEESLETIRYSLRVAKAADEIDYAKADFTYDKERMSEIQRRIDALDKAIEEVS